MDRRLHNNLTALAATGAVLVVALVSASPLPAPASASGALADAGEPAAVLLDALERAGAPVEAAVEAAVDGATQHKRAGGRDARDHRRIAMPYFTFLPRG
ncbi:hypothetical protein LY625_01250 [Lysobacter sp. GX 14042]|uniref:hypothetical protein n=1 Tax=Lysobacter sp. GX 14042 TaxID=2907155 RepID=UPI001F3968BE|nr:hypothetical protein [Lysobacter sp. GX 14042]MCE7031264.1 hypothetical protein [Lysobacter sp. GX 14042]